mmetsp:Transcript_48476/g.112343  ORF Transcript_48476/g.112343 Transcript_48476/m.112343 type:complete len:230 (+) Transcript_48476:52-741(+)|eukprot:CAMPEP_0171091866 /NCGR_PEP_ID=MMETSP0766_2-20121228/35368_1 /TAXON_ID=439317 /ORGANISM="Gambierdiscus australes, Strain CAWD 149" /LENGTH=229 /DNA_ID=CAMNT_0011550043 /DNA_START=52 /DNA_END=741 /DNA_ORIENTATION=-
MADSSRSVALMALPVMDGPDDKPLCLYQDCISGESLLPKAVAAGSGVRLLFLDVDGVLNQRAFTSTADDDSGMLSAECMAYLGAVLEADGFVVLSSTWRSDRELRNVVVSQLERLKPGCVVGQTPQDPSFRNDMRPQEIAAFLSFSEVAASVVTWCAVDDMDLLRQAAALAKRCKALRQILPEFQQRFVKTDKHVGLDASGATAILRVLGSPIEVRHNRGSAGGLAGSH